MIASNNRHSKRTVIIVTFVLFLFLHVAQAATREREILVVGSLPVLDIPWQKQPFPLLFHSIIISRFVIEAIVYTQNKKHCHYIAFTLTN